MENFSIHVPVFIANAGVATSGHSADLAGGQVGLFDRQTFSVATASGNGKEFFFAQGVIGGKDWYQNPTTATSHKSPFFMVDGIENMYLSLPTRRQNEEWIVGYNGADSSKTIKYVTGAEPVKVKFLFSGGPTYRFFGGPKEYVVSYSVDEDCDADCTTGCESNLNDPLTHVKKHIDLINKHTELQKFGVHASLISDTYVATSTNMEKFKLSLCDNGDGTALNLVKAQYPSLDVTRTSRSGSTSVYEVCVPSTGGDDTPAAFAYSASVRLSECSSCTNVTGSNVSPAQDFYFISRPLAGSEDLSSDNLKQTYANTVAASYFGKTFNATTAVDDATETITVTAHGYSVGQAVKFAVATGLIVGGITAGTTYYVIAAGLTANTFRVSTSRGGTAVNLTDAVGTNTVYPAPTEFVFNAGSAALIKVAVPEGVTVTALLADTVNFSHSEEAVCIVNAPSSISWVANGTGIRGERSLKLKSVKRPVCDAGGDRLTDVAATITDIPGIQIGTLALVEGDGCFDDYTVDQYSVDCVSEEFCLTNEVTFFYEDLPAFENSAWEVVPEAAGSNTDRKVGIRITADYKDIRFGNDSFDLMDYYETDPIKMEVAIWREWAGNCDVSSYPTVTQSKFAQIERQSGEWVVREAIMKTDAYQKHLRQYADSPRMREAFDMNLLGMVDRKAFYNLYYVTYDASYGKLWRKGSVKEKFTTIFAFKEDDPAQATFKATILNLLSAKSGVTMHVNA